MFVSLARHRALAVVFHEVISLSLSELVHSAAVNECVFAAHPANGSGDHPHLLGNKNADDLPPNSRIGNLNRRQPGNMAIADQGAFSRTKTGSPALAGALAWLVRR
jgi:hypothetical protein